MTSPMDVFCRAATAVENKDYEGALHDFVWLLENPDVASPRNQWVRRAYGFFGWANLATIYPPARAQFVQSMEKLRLSKDENETIDAKAMQDALTKAESA